MMIDNKILYISNKHCLDSLVLIERAKIEVIKQASCDDKELYNEIKKIKEEANKKYNEREALLNKEKDELKRERERILAEREEIRKAREKYEAENDRIRQQIAAFAEYMKEFDDDEEKAEEVGARKTV